jgi:Fic family protein
MATINHLYKEWLSLQPLKPEDQQRLDRKFMLDFNFNSNHLEGNTLTYGQTELLFMFGETTGSANLKDYEEMKAHNVGLEMVKVEASDKERTLSEAFIRELNKTILVRDFRKNTKTISGQATYYAVKVGVYKTRPNSVYTVTGEKFEYASPEETPAFMADLITWYNKEEKKGELSPIELAALFHYRYIRIHPFEDGNGRIARLLVNYILMRNNYPMIVIQSADKDNYLRVLHQCDIATGLMPSDGANAPMEKIRPFVEYLEIQAIYALKLAIKAGKGESVDEQGDLDKKLAVLKKELGESPQETIQITYGREAIENALEKGFFPLLLAWENKLKYFDPLFIDRNVRLVFYYNYTSSTKFLQAKTFDSFDVSQILINSLDVKKIKFSVAIKGIRKIHNGVGFSAKDIEILFHNNVYEINFSSEEKSIDKLYHQELNDIEINSIIEVLGNQLFNTIEQIKINYKE